MQFHSTNDRGETATFREAILKGLAPNNGLYVPASIPRIPAELWKGGETTQPHELATEIIWPFAEGSMERADLARICAEAISFPFPLVQTDARRHALELFHGPTLAFKDVGARFLARVISHFSQAKVTVLVATSGDTGSAVAQGFHGVEGIDVVLLYPKGRISRVQEQQLTTVGGNVQALEVDGAFDDCQAMVKQAFLDAELQALRPLTSANSINIARWIPQATYFASTVHALGEDVLFSVPSGNYGNLAAGLLAHQMGMPCRGFIAATNANDVVPEFLETGRYRPRPSVATISNAMDVGAPSNFVRLTHLFGDDLEAFRGTVRGFHLDDEGTRQRIKQVHDDAGYVVDPHGAIGHAALDAALEEDPAATGVFLHTAAPCKFGEVVAPVLGEEPAMPERLREIVNRPKQSVEISANDAALKAYLLG
ncbi:MAG: threonine synthase [Planctomycetota bacterium]|nr:threonine synthase [Planctomycetota bacterium]MDG1982989.1 threonine synthase [Planctomycetota bacterium]